MVVGQAGPVASSSRDQVFSDEQWARVEPLLPSNEGRQGRPFRDNRRVVEAIAYRYRTGIPWRDLPRERFGAWQTIWKRHRRYAQDGTWDRVLAQLIAEADARGQLDWTVSVDATITRAHQHAGVHHTPRAGHRGHGRITRDPRTGSSTAHSVGLVNPQVTESDGPGAGCPRRSTPPSTDTGDPCRWS